MSVTDQPAPFMLTPAPLFDWSSSGRAMRVEFTPVSGLVIDFLAAHPDDFIPRHAIAWAAQCKDLIWEPQMALTLDRIENAHRLFPHPPQRFVQIEGKRVIAPAGRAQEWPLLKGSVLGAFTVDDPLSYPELRARVPFIAEPDLQCVLNVFVWDGELTIDAPGGPADWASMTLTRPVPP
jgi:hypothetical protein